MKNMKNTVTKALSLLLALSIILAGIPATKAEAATKKLSGYSIDGFSDGLVSVYKNGKYGFMDKEGG